MEKEIIRVRHRQGTTSMDSTLLTEIIKNYDIEQGDLFEVEIICEKPLKICYTLIYKKKSKKI